MMGPIECRIAYTGENPCLALYVNVQYRVLVAPLYWGYACIHDERTRTMGSRDYGRPQAKTYLKTDNRDRKYIDYKSVEELRRLMTPNGKIYSRKRLGTSAKEQRMVAQAIKRARFMALLPFTSGTL